MVKYLHLFSFVIISLILSYCSSAVVKSTIDFESQQFKNDQDAILYFYSTEDQNFDVFVDNKLIGTLNEGFYLYVHVPAGYHEVKFKSKGVIENIIIKDRIFKINPLKNSYTYFKVSGSDVTNISDSTGNNEIIKMKYDPTNHKTKEL